MKKWIFLFATALLTTSMHAQTSCNINTQQPIEVLANELKRNFKTLQKLTPSIYYLSYTYQDLFVQSLRIKNNGIAAFDQYQDSSVQIFPRAGSPRLDNTRTLKTDRTYYDVLNVKTPRLTEDPYAFTTLLWRNTQQAVEQAQQDYDRVRVDVQSASKRADDSPDFAFPPKETFCQEAPALSFDTKRIEKLLLKASTLVQEKPFVLNSSFTFHTESGNRYFVDSVGTRLKTPVRFARLSYSIEGQTPDGASLQRDNAYDVLQESELPSEEQFLAALANSVQELQALTQAPEAQPIAVPAILKNRAMAVFVHEVLGHRVEGHRQKEDSFGQTFTDKIGQEIVSPLLSIVDDATLPYFKGIPLRGFYQYDDEGVKARPVVLVENGVLKGFLMNSSPINGFATSNGHGRAQPGKRPIARMGNTRVIANKTVSYDELEQLLLQEIKRQHKPYGVIIEDLSGGFTLVGTDFPQTFKLTPTLVYRLYPDGRKEVIRGADMVGTPLASFHEVIAAADDDAVFNGSCGSQSGWVPVSGIAPSVLLRRLELEKTEKSGSQPPLLPPPLAEGK